MSIKESLLFGKKSIELNVGCYSATIIPDYGCNVVSLIDTSKNITILKTPADNDVDEFMHAPQHFGNAVLFPPNRITNAGYTKNGITYKFLSDEVMKLSNSTVYAHGILRFMKFIVESVTEADDKITLTATYHSCPGEKIYETFPHEFICTMKFVLSGKGLFQSISFKNLGTTPMPVGVGFHTAFQLPNDNMSTRDDYRIILSAGKHIELNSSTLPTGKFLPLVSDCRNIGIRPFEPIEDEHTTVSPLKLNKKDFHGVIIKNIKTNNNIYFETNENFGYWMLWNNRSRSNYVCIEPMSWIINAPNIPLPDELTGYTQINPGENWTGTLNISTLPPE